VIRERERVTPEGEQDIVAPSGVVHGEVQRDRDERTDVLHGGGGLDVDAGDDSGIGKGGSIRATAAWASSARMAAARSSSSRSAWRQGPESKRCHTSSSCQ
jgi:hypothetical protein